MCRFPPNWHISSRNQSQSCNYFKSLSPFYPGVLEKQQALKMLNSEKDGIGLFFSEEYCYDVNQSGQVERGLNIYTIWSTNYDLQGLTPM